MSVSCKWWWGPAAALLAFGPGCAHSGVSQQDDAQQVVQEYRLAKEDVVEVSVWKEPDLSRTVPVRPDGKITLPLLGDLPAEGLTTGQLEKSVQDKLSPLVRDPRVTVIVHDVNGSRIYVTGMVTRPGAFPLRSHMTVLQALAMAGGLAEFADRGEITVLHADGTRHVVAYDDLVNGKVRRQLSAGDTVVVP